MDAYKSIISCGPRLRKALTESAEISEVTSRIFPVVSEIDQPLPFITFFRSGATEEAVKSMAPGIVGPRSATFQFQIFSKEWGEGLKLADAVLATLHGFHDDVIRLCSFSDATENFDPAVPAYVQILTFRVKI